MNNLEKSQQVSGTCIRSSEDELILKSSIAVAMERVGTEPFDMSNMVKDVLAEFSQVETKTITNAIRKGSLGEYGYTYKLTTQVVCIWVREFIKDNRLNGYL